MGAFGPSISKELADKIQKECKVKLDLHQAFGDSINPVILTALGFIEPNINGVTSAIVLIEEANPNWKCADIEYLVPDLEHEKSSAIFLPKNGW